MAGQRESIAVVAHRGYARTCPENTIPALAAAIDAGSGEELWKLQGEQTKDYEGATLAVRGPNVVYALKDSLLCIDRETGRQRWRGVFPWI